MQPPERLRWLPEPLRQPALRRVPWRPPLPAQQFSLQPRPARRKQRRRPGPALQVRVSWLAPQRASGPVSPVRIRMTCSRLKTKTLPSPILSVLADFSIASITCSSCSALTAASIFTLGKKSTTYSAPRYSSVCPFCRPKPFTSVTVMPCTPMAESASRTSSSLNGLMMAVTNFMIGSSPFRLKFAIPRRRRPVYRRGMIQVLLEGFGNGQDGDATPGILGLGAAVGEAVKLARTTTAIGVGVDIGQAEDVTGDILGHAKLPVGVTDAAGACSGISVVIGVEVTNVAVDTPTIAQIVAGGQVEIAAALGFRQAKVIGDGVAVLQGQELPATRNVQFAVVDGAGDIGGRVLGVSSGQRGGS